MYIYIIIYVDDGVSLTFQSVQECGKVLAGGEG